MTQSGIRRRPKALVFLDFDMLVRHFVLSGVFRELEAAYDVRYVFHADSTSPKKGIYTDWRKLGLRDAVEFELPRARYGLWHDLFSITALRNQRGTDNFRHRLALMRTVNSAKRTRRYSILSLPFVYPLIRRRHLRRLGVYAPLEKFLRAEAPDVVIHPSILTGYFINELLTLCPRLGIPTLLLMNSWDNPSTKATGSGIPDRLVVWGPQTRDHAIRYMRVPPERILEFGAAQFDVYREPVRESREALCREFGVPADRPILLYAGVSKSVNETSQLAMLERAIDEGRIPKCHILYRPHPWRGELVAGERHFDEMGLRHVSLDPHMAEFYRRVAVGGTSGFDMADYKVTVRLLTLVDAVVSPLSTIMLEAAILGKPSLAFLPDDFGDLGAEQGRLWRDLPHFAGFWRPPYIDICFDAAKLANACAVLLHAAADPATAAALRDHAAKFVVLDGKRYGERMRDLVDTMVAA